MQYIIEGGKKLEGEVNISGNKNSILPCMAAALLTDGEVILENVPQIADVNVFIEIFEKLNIKVKRESNSLSISSKEVKNQDLPTELVKKLRASILLVGPLLSRFGRVSFNFPGGDVIGRRSIDVHLNALMALGANFKKEDSQFILKLETQKQKNCKIFLEEASVTATENLILASVLGEGTLEIRNFAREPHILDLCQCLNKMGANIKIIDDVLKIERVKKLKGVKFRVSDDHIQIATYAVAAAITSGKVKIVCDPQTDMEPIFTVLSKFGLRIEKLENGFLVHESRLVGVEKIVTNIWPGFPTDLMSVAIVLATQARGETLCHDWMYESRMFFVDKLIAMGADVTIADPHRVVVYGPSSLKGRELETPDIRAGMALVLAALVAKGKSVINKSELIERGYEDVVGKMKSLGATIESVS